MCQPIENSFVHAGISLVFEYAQGKKRALSKFLIAFFWVWQKSWNYHRGDWTTHKNVVKLQNVQKDLSPPPDNDKSMNHLSIHS